MFSRDIRTFRGRHFRTTADAFPQERAISVEHFLSNKPRHRVMRFLRNLARWLLGPRP